MTDDDIFVEYKGKKTKLTVAGNPRKFLKPNTIAGKYGSGGTSFVRNTLRVADYSSASKKTQQQTKRASISARDVLSITETPTGRRDQTTLEEFWKVFNDQNKTWRA